LLKQLVKALIVTVLMYFCFPATLPDKVALGGWFKCEDHGFWIRVPAEWSQGKVNSKDKHRVAWWLGPEMTEDVRGLGKVSFRARADILWLESKPMGSITMPEKGTETTGKDKGSGREKDEISEEERKKLLNERYGRIRARDFEQWLGNFSGLTGLRMLEKKQTDVAGLPAVEYEFLSKTNRQVNFKHYAVSVNVSGMHEVVFLYSVLENEYRKWNALFQRAVNSLEITSTEKFGNAGASAHDAGRPSAKAAKPAAQYPDILITPHGSYIEGVVQEKHDGFQIELGGESIEVPASLVRDVEYGTPPPFEPKTEKDKERVANGYTRFQDRWMLKSSCVIEIKKARERLREKIDELKKHSDPSNPWVRRTSLFTVETTTSEELLDRYCNVLDELIDTFEEQLKVNVSREASKRKPTVRVFKDYREYLRFSRMPGTGGYFSFSDNTLNLYHNFEDPGFTEWVLLHEGTHLLNFLYNTSFAGRPHWIEEGTAEYFGSCKISTDRWGKLVLEPGQILGNRLVLVAERIQTGKVNKLRKALATDSYQYEDYAYWWSFTHFMITHPRYKDRFLKFYKKLYSLRGFEKIMVGADFYRVTPEESVAKFEKNLGISDWDALQKEWEEFILINMKQVDGYGWMVLGRDLYNESFRVKEKDKDKKKQKQDELQERALDALVKAIDEMGYNKAASFYYRSMVYKEHKEFTKALLDIEKAIELNPLNEKFYQRRASLLYKNGEKNAAIRDMRIAIALNPLDLVLPVILEEMMMGVYVDLSRG